MLIGLLLRERNYKHLNHLGDTLIGHLEEVPEIALGLRRGRREGIIIRKRFLSSLGVTLRKSLNDSGVLEEITSSRNPGYHSPFNEDSTDEELEREMILEHIWRLKNRFLSPTH
eukprot:TRINITY_DN358_c0_g3_i4.p1 TRINITY_DN358_c0_g3~~TRINITY_DN358_c0_g3_i4.p1  ORF type:complete len:114 (-),score=20.81 TRINITY_DN358_c0_g3_i4:24-365(-)